MKGNADVIFIMHVINKHVIFIKHANRYFPCHIPLRGTIPEQGVFSRNNNALDEQFSLALQYVSSPAPSALPDKETREGGLCAPLPGS